MKHAKRTLTLLLTAAMLSACLLPMAGCKKTTTDDLFENDQGNGLFGDASTAVGGYDPEAPHGELKLYGKTNTVNPRSGNMWFGIDEMKIVYSTVDDPTIKNLLCFDSLCDHDKDDPYFCENCVASIHPYAGSDISYPIYMIADDYDNVSSPVLYLAYRPSENVYINEVRVDREPDFCIERFDFSVGQRVTLISGIKDNLTQMITYGDYIYYVIDDTMYRLDKAGGKPIDLKVVDNESIKILEIFNDTIYFSVGGRYVYTSSLDFSRTQEFIDLANIKVGENPGVIQWISGNYLFFFANYETVQAFIPNDPVPYEGEQCDCYRLPLDDIQAEPELVAEDFASDSLYNRFTENVLYYQPMVFEYVGEGDTAVNVSDGILKVIDLQTLESKTIVENSNMVIYLKHVFDDLAVFSGYAYNSDGYTYAGNFGDQNYVIAFTNGDPFRVWCKRNEF